MALRIDSDKIHPWKKDFFVLVPKRDKYGRFTNTYSVRISMLGILTICQVACYSLIGIITLYAFGAF